MKISVLGTNGFLSLAIAKYANDMGWNLDMYGLYSPVGHSYNHYYPIDLMHDVLDCTLLQDSDMIIYAIGAGIQSNLAEGADMIYNLNVTAPVRICNCLRELNYHGIFVTFGSVFEIGETDERRSFNEQDILQSNGAAPSDYVVSKRMLTRFVSAYKHDFVHWHFIIPTIYGPGENPKRLIPYTIGAICGHQPLHFTAGNQVRQYVYVGEVPRLLDLAYKKTLSSGVYAIEGKETLSVRQIVELIHSYYHQSVPDDCFGKEVRNDVGMQYLALDGTKLRDAIGYVSTIGIQEVISQYE